MCCSSRANHRLDMRLDTPPDYHRSGRHPAARSAHGERLARARHAMAQALPAWTRWWTSRDSRRRTAAFPSRLRRSTTRPPASRLHIDRAAVCSCWIERARACEARRRAQRRRRRFGDRRFASAGLARAAVLRVAQAGLPALRRIPDGARVARQAAADEKRRLRILDAAVRRRDRADEFPGDQSRSARARARNRRRERRRRACATSPPTSARAASR